MMTHDPFQNYQAQGGYAGGVTPFGIPYAAQQFPFANPGIGGYGIHPQALQAIGLQGAGIPGQQSQWQQPWGPNPLAAALQNPLLQSALLQGPLAQNPYQQNLFQQNPLMQNPFQQNPFQQNPFLQQHALAYHGWPQQQSQFGYPLAPQSFLGAGGNGQLHPLAQLALRQAGGYGISPLAGGF